MERRFASADSGKADGCTSVSGKLIYWLRNKIRCVESADHQRAETVRGAVEHIRIFAGPICVRVLPDRPGGPRISGGWTAELRVGCVWVISNPGGPVSHGVVQNGVTVRRI